MRHSLSKTKWSARLALLGTFLWLGYAGAEALKFFRSQREKEKVFDRGEVDAIFSRFSLGTPPRFTASLTQIIGPSRIFAVAPELLDPASALPQAYRYDRKLITALFNAEKNCGNEMRIQAPTDPGLRKYFQYIKYICGKENLPRGFLKAPPFSAPLGGSWAKRLVDRGLISPTEALPYLHFLELSTSLGSVPEIPSELLHLSPEHFFRLLIGQTLIPTPELLLWVDEKGLIHGYLRSSWDQFLDENSLWVSSSPSPDQCLGVVREGLCWVRKGISSDQGVYSKLLITVALLLSWVGVLTWQKFRLRQNSREERDLMIQTLAHELRHPAASIQLSLEAFRRDFDGLPDIAKDEFLRMTDQVQKLSRVIHASRSYLQSTNEGDPGFRFDFQAVESTFGLISEIIAPYEGKIEARFLGQDLDSKLDAYWTGLCLTNLIKNALIHGKPPISLEVELNEKTLRLQVSDTGTSKLSLEEMLAPFHKREGSPGMGLGLSLTDRIATRMGGQLTFADSPTRFILELPRFREPYG